MKRLKNSVTLTLIFSSTILLLTLQLFWLQKVYTEELEKFHKETNALLHNVVFAMNDSLLLKSVEPLAGDSSAHYFSAQTSDTLHLYKQNNFRYKDSTALIQVMVSSGKGDSSFERYLKPLITKIKSDIHQKRFAIRLSPDTLPITAVQHKFAASLKSANIDVPFVITHLKLDHTFPPRRVRLTEQDVYTPSGGYHLEFQNLMPLMIRKISPQILFSVFLTLLTIASFFLLYRSLRMQQRLMQLKNDFISNITHELKTPVTTVGVAIEALRDFKGMDNPKLTQEYLDIARNELDRLTTLTDKILKTAVLENKGVDYTSEPLEIDRLVEHAIDSMKLLIEKYGAIVTLEKQGTDFNLKGGRSQLTSVVCNLLDNALKYGSMHSKIIVVLKENEEQVILLVKDQGSGIAKEFQKKVFEKFFRIPTGDVHNIKGYGLGLSYVESIVKSHGGRIELESEPGKGSCFKIVLPK